MGLFSLFSKDTTQEKPVVPVLPQEIYARGVLELQDVLAPSALQITPKQLNIGDKVARTFFVISYPRFLTTGWFAPIINLDKMFDAALHIHPVDTTAILRQFQKRVAEVESQIQIREEKGLVRDPQLDTAYSDLEYLRDRLQQAQEKMFEVGLYITIYGQNDEELDKTETEVRSILEARLVYIKPTLFQQEQGFKSVMPIGDDELAVHSKLNSEPLSSTFPFISFDLTSDRGILYGINRHNSSLVLFDRFSLENYNSVLFAKSGSGKSYFTKLEILRSLMFDADVIVIDPEREYEYLAETTGGRYFNITLSSENHINPFDLPVPREDENPADVLRSNIITLVGLFRIMLGGLTPEEDAIVDKAITETYALKDINAESDFTNIEPPLLSDFELAMSCMSIRST
jgi:type IV secretory pathway VirB4 component